MRPWEETKSVTTSILGGGGGFVHVQEQFAENTNKSYHVCRVIIVLHIYHKMFGIR